jgi:glycosyltransferase involved in cell wall biosynthesis
VLSLPPDAQVVSIIGRLRPEKNHEMFLRMANCVRRELPSAVFLVVGDGPMESGLHKLAASLGIEDAVRFLGLRDDIGDLLAATDVCVVTSPREGLANSLVEAMSVGVPVISTDYTGVEEVVSDDVEGFVVPRDDAEAMAARVVLLLADDSLRKRMGAAGIKRVAKQFGLGVMGGRLHQVYSDHLQEARHRSRGRSR